MSDDSSDVQGSYEEEDSSGLDRRRKLAIFIGGGALLLIAFFEILVGDPGNSKDPQEFRADQPLPKAIQEAKKEKMSEEEPEESELLPAEIPVSDEGDTPSHVALAGEKLSTGLSTLREASEGPHAELIAGLDEDELRQETVDVQKPEVAVASAGDTDAELTIEKTRERKRSVEERLRNRIKEEEGIELDHSELILRLVGSLRDKDNPRLVQEAAILLREIARKSDAQLLTEQLTRGDIVGQGRVFLIDVIGRMGDERSLKALFFEMENGPAYAHGAIVRALGQLKDDRAIPTLLDVINRGSAFSDQVRQSAVSSLGFIGSEAAIYAMRAGIKSRDKVVTEALKWAYAFASGEKQSNVRSTNMPAGRKVLILNFDGTQYYFYHPTRRKNQNLPSRLLVCIHDMSLRARWLYEACRRGSAANRVAVLAPVFDNMSFPDYQYFNLQGMRADKRLLDLLEHISQHAPVSVREIFLFGVGKGGRFVQNFAFTYPARVGRAVIASDSLMVADKSKLFPVGIGRSPFAPDLTFDLDKVVKLDLLYMGNERAVSRARELQWKALEEYAQKEGLVERLAFDKRSVLGPAALKQPEVVFGFLFPKD